MASRLRILVIACTLLAAVSAQATVPIEGAMSAPTPVDIPTLDRSLDETCWFTFLRYLYGGTEGSTTWPGGSGDYRMTGLVFWNSCTNEEVVTYCTDLDHTLATHTYCVAIESLSVRMAYPEQYPAMAYVMSHHIVGSTLDDEVMQLAIWKLSNEMRSSSPNFGVPYYYIPSPRDPAFPYVNTVFNSEPTVNDPANVWVLDAIGHGPDGIAKNVVMCDDELAITIGETLILEGIASVPLTIQLVRGASSAMVNNASLSGVHVHVDVVDGTLNTHDVFTDASGRATVIVSKEIGSPVPAQLRFCSKSVWPKRVAPCPGWSGQQLLVIGHTAASLCSVCVNIPVSPDHWLAAELASFEASAGALGIDLTWTTSSEASLDRWEIERGEGARWSVVATIPAINSAGGSDYRFTDQSAETGVVYRYRLVSVSLTGAREVHDSMIRSAVQTAPASAVAEGYWLGDNYPNPFNPQTHIRFNLPEAGVVTLTVYDAVGREVATLVNGSLDAGEHSVDFKADHLPSALYFYKLTAGSFTQTKKMILIK